MKRTSRFEVVSEAFMFLVPSSIPLVPLVSPNIPRDARAANTIISGGDLEACRPIGQIGKANFRPLPPHSRSEEHTSELQSRPHLVCRLLLEKKKTHPKLQTWTPREYPVYSCLGWHKGTSNRRAIRGTT